MSSFDLSSKWLLLLFLLLQTSEADKCETCRNIVTKFKEGLSSTAKANYGGGNTAWEERKLTTGFAHSETRLIEILEKISAGNKEESLMVEEHEETIEGWWFEDYANDHDADLFKFLCINNIKVCCENGTFGPECKECSGGKKRPCSGHGECKGNGTRKGNGKCKCNDGYTGDVCDDCAEKYYEETNEDGSVVCEKCDVSCEDTCASGGPKGCDDCSKGWTASEEEGCVDVDECTAGDAGCDPNEYCVNNPGSFTCAACSYGCMGCHGEGESQCIICNEKFYKLGDLCIPCHAACLDSCTDGTVAGCGACAEGWVLTDEGCQDVNECEGEAAECSDNEYCVNTPGSFSCSTCHSACEGCVDAGADKCLQCKLGYRLDEEKMCRDIDECELGESCTAEHEECVNSVGSFTCRCEHGYKRKDDRCVLPQKGRRKKTTRKRSRQPSSAEGENKVDRTVEGGESSDGTANEEEEAHFSPEEEMILMEGAAKPKGRKEFSFANQENDEL